MVISPFLCFTASESLERVTGLVGSLCLIVMPPNADSCDDCPPRTNECHEPAKEGRAELAQKLQISLVFTSNIKKTRDEKGRTGKNFPGPSPQS